MGSSLDRTGGPERNRVVQLGCPSCGKIFDLRVGRTVQVEQDDDGYCDTCSDPYARVKIECPHCTYVLLEGTSRD